jgi:hypothetical protein
MEEKKESISTWLGKPLIEYSKEELIKIIEFLLEFSMNLSDMVELPR